MLDVPVGKLVYSPVNQCGLVQLNKTQERCGDNKSAIAGKKPSFFFLTQVRIKTVKRGIALNKISGEIVTWFRVVII